MKQNSIDFMDPKEREYWAQRRSREERAEREQANAPTCRKCGATAPNLYEGLCELCTYTGGSHVTTPTTFEPDWREILKTYACHKDAGPRQTAHLDGLQAVIIEYTRQLDAAGFVIVPVDTLAVLRDYYTLYKGPNVTTDEVDAILGR